MMTCASYEFKASLNKEICTVVNAFLMALTMLSAIVLCVMVSSFCRQHTKMKKGDKSVFTSINHK